MGKFKRPNGGYYTEEEVRQTEGEKRGESGGLLVDNLHSRPKAENNEKKIIDKTEPARTNSNDQTKGLPSKVGSKNARKHTFSVGRRKL